MEFINEIWVWIATAIGGVSLAGIISTIIYACLRGAFNKTISKINVQKIAELATDKGIEKIKNVSFEHSIQPLVESGLEKINEKALSILNEQLKLIQGKYDKLVNVLDKLSAYFDNSIGVTDNAKQELKEAISEAKGDAPVKATSTAEIDPAQGDKKTTSDNSTDSGIQR